MNSIRAILAAVRARVLSWRLPSTWLEPEDAFWPTLHDYPYTN
jgi:hypothetical protein